MANYEFLAYFLTSFLLLYYYGPAFFNAKTSNVPIVKAPVGEIGGIGLKSHKGRDIFAYRAIPYAKPPIGDLRFKKSQALPENSWEGVFDGSGTVTKCTQPSEIPFIIPVNGNEDCLHLNVYVPKTSSSETKLPVMVWFHGGGFTSGDSSSRLYGPDYLLDKDVILVTINYRLGIFGFLSLGHDLLAGNQGMWDQNLALRWVHKNIQAFGGDPKKVTIFGESAGGFSVSYHLMSYQSGGLFQAAIVQSGPLERGPRPKKERSIVDVHLEFSRKMGCPVNVGNVQEAVECLQSKPANELMKGLQMFDQCNTLATGMMAFPVIWTPVSDASYSKDPFFKDDPIELLNSGKFNKVPVIIGAMKEEGLLHTSTMLQNPKLMKHFKMHWDECSANSFLNVFFQSESEIQENYKEELKAVNDFYFEGSDEEIRPKHWTFTNLTLAFGDSKFVYGTDKMAQILSKHTTTFYYHFDHQGSFSLSDIFSSSHLKLLWTLAKKVLGFHDSKKLGVCHADDLLYLFKSSLPVVILPDERDQKMIEFMVDLWTNFATFHDPTPKDKKWPSVGTKSQHYVILEDSNIIKETDSYRNKRIEFWHQLAKKMAK